MKILSSLVVVLSNFAVSINALNSPVLSTPSTNTCFRMAGYWGQNSVGTFRQSQAQWEKPLAEYCETTTWDIILVSFMHIFYHGNPPLPGLNFAYHCENAPFPGYPYLLQCPDISAGIKSCQARGKIILLSMGGAAANGQFVNEQAGIDYATLLWNMFMGGGGQNVIRPFGDAIFDGIDLDIEGGSPVGYGSFVNRLRELYATDTRKNYYVAGAPQCPFPDAFLGPTGFYDKYVLGISHLDFVFVQFYNNYCGVQSYPGANFNFETWNNWAKEKKTQVFLGVPAASYSGGGYQSAARVKEIAGSLIDRYGPSSNGWFGGVMTWDVGSAEDNVVNGLSFSSDVSQYLKSRSPAGACTSPNVPPPSPTSPPAAPSSSSRVAVASSVQVSTSSSRPPASSSTRPASSATRFATSSSILPSPSPSAPPPPPPPPPPSSGCGYNDGPSEGPGGLWSELPVANSVVPIKQMTTTVHLVPVLRLDPTNLKAQVLDILKWSQYNDASKWVADTSSNENYVCAAMAPIDQYGQNPTQMFIGKPAASASITISNTPVNIRLPDKWFGMFLAYAMDDYGLNPHSLMGLSVKETFTPAVAPGSDANRDFLAANVADGYDLYGQHFGYGTDANKDGPFQVEKFTAATSFAMFPARVKLDSSQSSPSYDLDTTIASSAKLDSLHQFWVKNIYRSVILTALDFHWRYNALLLVPYLGMKTPWQRRNVDGRDSLEFASMMYAYNRGVYGDLKSKTCSCADTANPITQCGLNGFGGHAADIQNACKLLDKSTEVYDYSISFAEVNAFIAVLESTFPYSANGADFIHGPIDWSLIRSNSKAMFDQISAYRSSRGGVVGNSATAPLISFRYDWRLMMAVIRAHLPARENLVGPTWYGMVTYSFGNLVGNDPGYKFTTQNLPLQYQGESGSRTWNTGPPSPPPPPPPGPSPTPSPVPSQTQPTSPALPSSTIFGPIPIPTTIETDVCICTEEDGFLRTRAPGFAIKDCPAGSAGVLMNVCSLLPNGRCRWGVPKSFCVTTSGKTN